jgi:hypothetical protein
METETRRASELGSTVRQGAGLYPRCCADQKEEKGMEADANTATLSRLGKNAKGQRTGQPGAQRLRYEDRKSNEQFGKGRGTKGSRRFRRILC